MVVLKTKYKEKKKRQTCVFCVVLLREGGAAACEPHKRKKQEILEELGCSQIWELKWDLSGFSETCTPEIRKALQAGLLKTGLKARGLPLFRHFLHAAFKEIASLEKTNDSIDLGKGIRVLFLLLVFRRAE